MLKIFTNKACQDVKAYLLIDESSKRCVLIDTAIMDVAINEYIRKNGLILETVMITHAHWDHFGGLKQILDANVTVDQVLIGADDLIHINDLDINLSAVFTSDHQRRNTGLNVHDNRFMPLHDRLSKIQVDKWLIYAIHVPGHTPGGYVFWFPDHNLFFTGDTLMIHGIGATDKALGSRLELESSLYYLWQILHEHVTTLMMPGHHDYASFSSVVEGNEFFNYLVNNHAQNQHKK